MRWHRSRCVSDASAAHRSEQKYAQAQTHAGAPGLAYGRVPTASQGGLASWGGSIVKDADGLYHLFAAEMSLDCGLTVRNPALRSRCQSAALY